MKSNRTRAGICSSCLDTRPSWSGVHTSAVFIDPTIPGEVQEEVVLYPLDIR